MPPASPVAHHIAARLLRGNAHGADRAGSEGADAFRGVICVTTIQPPEVAITELRACSPAAFDARVVEALASAVADGRVD